MSHWLKYVTELDSHWVIRTSWATTVCVPQRVSPGGRFNRFAFESRERRERRRAWSTEAAHPFPIRIRTVQPRLMMLPMAGPFVPFYSANRWVRVRREVRIHRSWDQNELYVRTGRLL